MPGRFFFFALTQGEIGQGEVGQDEFLIEIERPFQGNDGCVIGPLFLEDGRLQVIWPRVQAVGGNGFFRPLQGQCQVSLVGVCLCQQCGGLRESRSSLPLRDARQESGKFCRGFDIFSPVVSEKRLFILGNGRSIRDYVVWDGRREIPLNLPLLKGDFA